MVARLQSSFPSLFLLLLLSPSSFYAAVRKVISFTFPSLFFSVLLCQFRFQSSQLNKKGNEVSEKGGVRKCVYFSCTYCVACRKVHWTWTNCDGVEGSQ